MKAYTKKTIVRQLTQNAINDQAERYDMILAYVLHSKRHTRKYILDFLRSIIDAHIYTNDLYGQAYQDSAYRELLRKDGIDMHEIEVELEEYAKSKGIVY